jgi:hypothetical protein
MFTMSLPRWARGSFAADAEATGAEGAAAGVGAGGAAGLTDSSRFHIAENLPLFLEFPEGAVIEARGWGFGFEVPPV